MESIQIGDVGLNAEYFGKKEQKEAVKELSELTANPGKNDKEKAKWAENAYKAMKDHRTRFEDNTGDH